MTDVNTVQNSNLALANWLYGVQNISNEKPNEFQEIGGSIAFGLPVVLGIPMAMEYGSKPFQVYKEMKKTPNAKYFETWKNLNKAKAYLKDDKSIFKTLKNKNLYGNLINLEKELPQYNPNTDVSKLTSSELTKIENSKIKSSYYEEAKRLIQEAKDKKMTGAELKAQLNKIREAVRKGDLKYNEAIQNGTIKQTSKIGKSTHWLKTKSGVYKAESKLLKTAKGASALKFAKKGLKGTWLMAVVEGVTEIPEIIKAYQIDKQERKDGVASHRGKKQVIKSTTKVGAGILGYALGSAATGAAAGTIFPGIGNIAGAAIGFVGGLIGGAIASWGAGKITDAALNEKDSLNKSEAEMYAEEKNNEKQEAAKALAEKADNSKSAQEKLLLATAKKAEKEGGFDDQATLDAYKELIAQREESAKEASDNSIQLAQAEEPEYDPVVNQLEGLANINYIS